MIRCSIRFSGAARMGVNGPSVFFISFRFCVSVCARMRYCSNTR